jgi:protein tyrosine/serine phosphatase
VGAAAIKQSLATGNPQDFIDNLPDGDLLPRMYLSVLYHSRERIAEVLEHLINPENYPAVFNCMMGQDRTGVTAFLLLGLLDVPLAVRVADYGASLTPAQMKNNSAIVAKMAPAMVPPGLEFTQEQREMLEQRILKNMTIQENFIETVEAKLVKDFGGVRGYIRWVGITDAQVDAYRAAMLDCPQ